MTTQLAFILGMLSIVSIAMLIGTVWSLLGVYTLEAKVKAIQSSSHESFKETLREISDMEKRFDDIYRHVDSRFDKFENKLRNSGPIKINIDDLDEEAIQKTIKQKQLIKS